MKYKPDKKYDPDADWDSEHALPMLYSRAAGGAINTWEVWLDKAGGVVVRWGQKGGALQTTVFQCERKNIGRANATSVVAQARLEAIAKWRKQLKKKYFLTEGETAQLNLKPMLAKSFADRESKVTYPVDVQPKFDGVRCLAFRKDGVVVLQSRGGDPYDVEHIREVLEERLDDDTVLDGEIYIHGMSLQNIISLVKRPQDGSLKLTYQVYDRTLLSEQTEAWVERRDALAEWFRIQLLDEMPWFICGVRTYSALNATKVRLLHDQFVEDGYEGAIIRLHDGLYRFGYRSSELLKRKAFEDAEFEIVGHVRGKGKFANVPIFNCKTDSGIEFEVTPRGTAEERANMLKRAKSLYGRMMTVRYMGWSDDGKPKIAVGVCIREPGT